MSVQAIDVDAITPPGELGVAVLINKLHLIVLPSLTKASTGEGVAGKRAMQKSQAVYSFC